MRVDFEENIKKYYRIYHDGESAALAGRIPLPDGQFRPAPSLLWLMVAPKPLPITPRLEAKRFFDVRRYFECDRLSSSQARPSLARKLQGPGVSCGWRTASALGVMTGHFITLG